MASSGFKSANRKDDAREGIIYFEPKDISPRVWKLDIRDDDYPVVYVNKDIPEPQVWACQDPVFISSVLPTVLEMVWLYIFRIGDGDETNWMESWVSWADQLMPGQNPAFDEEHDIQMIWIEKLIDSFAQRHQLSNLLLATLKTGK